MRLSRFAADLTAHGCPVTAGQVSRWESGLVSVSHRAVAGYETVLGLRTKSLVTVVDGLYRQHTPRLSPSRLQRRPAPSGFRDRARDLLDRAAFDGAMEAADWDELTVSLTAHVDALLPDRLWEKITRRLLNEQLVSDGDAWRLRSESTHRLLWLPDSRRHVVAACAAIVRDPASQIVIEPLVILDVVDDPAATALIVGQLTEPANERALRGALLSAVTKVRHHQFGPGHLRRVNTAVLDLLTDTQWSPAVRPIAGELVGHLPPALRTATTRRLRKALTSDPALTTAVTAGRTGRSHQMIDRIAAAATSHTPAYIDDTPDGLLTQLIDEMLFSANADTRLHAAQLAGTTPFRHPLADAYCTELRKPSVARDPTIAGALLEALPFVAGPEHRRIVETMLAAPGLPSATVDAAAWTIGHLPGHSSNLFWTTALRRRGPCLRGLVYALGITGQHARLIHISKDPDMPAEARTAARWWANR